MEFVWNLYGIPMEQHLSNIVIPRSHGAQDTLPIARIPAEAKRAASLVGLPGTNCSGGLEMAGSVFHAGV